VSSEVKILREEIYFWQNCVHPSGKNLKINGKENKAPLSFSTLQSICSVFLIKATTTKSWWQPIKP